MLGNFNCCKCDLKQPRDSQTAKFSQLAQPWWAGFNEGRGGGRGKKGEEGGREGSDRDREDGREMEGEGKGKEGKGFKIQYLHKTARG